MVLWYRFILGFIFICCGACVSVDTEGTATSQSNSLSRQPLFVTPTLLGACDENNAHELEEWLTTFQAVKQNAPIWGIEALGQSITLTGDAYNRLLTAHDAMATRPTLACALEARETLLGYLLGMASLLTDYSQEKDITTQKEALDKQYLELERLEAIVGEHLERITSP